MALHRQALTKELWNKDIFSKGFWNNQGTLDERQHYASRLIDLFHKNVLDDLDIYVRIIYRTKIIEYEYDENLSIVPEEQFIKHWLKAIEEIKHDINKS